MGPFEKTKKKKKSVDMMCERKDLIDSNRALHLIAKRPFYILEIRNSIDKRSKEICLFDLNSFVNLRYLFK